ncbi:unnamed protein product [Peniophora sp. CBMAI 1063]|nr:unnamed protein product [Peniophora sp. CBMAI 1063]
MSFGASVLAPPLHLSSLPPKLQLTEASAADYAWCTLIDLRCRWGSCEVKPNCLSAMQQHYHKHSARAHEHEHRRGADAEYVCRVKQCSNFSHTSMGKLGDHIDKAHIDSVPVPCPMKECLYTFTTSTLPSFHQHLESSHSTDLRQNISPLDSFKPLANPWSPALPPNPPLLPSSAPAAKSAYHHPVIPAKRRGAALTRTLSAISATGSSMQSISGTPRKRTRLSTRAFDPPTAPVAGPSSARAPTQPDEDGDDWDDISATKHFGDLTFSARAWNAPNLFVKRAKGPRWDKQCALGGDVVVQPRRAFPPKKKVQLSEPPSYKGPPQMVYKMQPDLLTTFVAMEERHKRLEENGLFTVEPETTWVTRDGTEV